MHLATSRQMTPLEALMRPTRFELATFGLKDRRQSRSIGSMSRNLKDPELKGPAKGPK
jgi:hypothetical protein